MTRKTDWRRKLLANQKMIYILLYLSVCIISSVVCLFFYYPNLNDEYNVLSISACFAGKDWSDFASVTKSYHGFGQAVLYVPLFYIFKNPITIYQGALIINSLVIALAAPVFYYVLTHYFGVKSKRKSAVMAFALGTLPFYLTYAKNVWNETMCAIVTLLIFVFTLRTLKVWERKKAAIFNTIVIALLVGYGYMVHGRMLVFAAVVPTALILWLLFTYRWSGVKKNFKQILLHVVCYVLVFAVMLVICKAVKGYLNDNLWGHLGLNATVGDFAERKLAFLMSFSNLKVLVKLIIGQVFYLILTTQGLAIVAFLAVLVAVYNMIKVGKDGRQDHFYNLLGIMILVAYGAALMLSAVSLLSGTLTANVGRVDYILYGRYTENIYPLIICFALLTLFRNKIKNHKCLFIIANVIFGAIVLVFFRFVMPLYLSMKRAGHSSITNIIPFSGVTIVTGRDWMIYQAFYKTVAICWVLFLVIQILIFWKKQSAICIVIVAISAYSFGYTMIERRLPASVAKYDRVLPLLETMGDTEVLESADTIYLILNGTEYPSEFQWTFMDKACVAIFNTVDSRLVYDTLAQIDREGIIISEGDLNMDYYIDSCYELSGKGIAEEVLPGEEPVFPPFGYKVWVHGENLKAAAERDGYTLQNDENYVIDSTELEAYNGAIKNDAVILGNQGLVSSGAVFAPEGTYEIVVNGKNLDEAAYGVFSNTFNNMLLTLTPEDEEYNKYMVRFESTTVTDDTMHFVVSLECGTKDLQVHVGNTQDKDIEIYSMEIIKK